MFPNLVAITVFYFAPYFENLTELELILQKMRRGLGTFLPANFHVQRDIVERYTEAIEAKKLKGPCEQHARTLRSNNDL